MGNGMSSHGVPVTRWTAAALLSSALVQRLAAGRVELCSEILCWLLLPTLSRAAAAAAARRPQGAPARSSRAGPLSLRDSPQRHAGSALSLWVAALCIVLSCLSRAEIRLLAFFPALTPSLLAVQRHFGSSYSSVASASASTSASASYSSWLFYSLANTLWGTSLVALLFILTLSDWDFRGHALSALPVLALLGVYLTFMPKSERRKKVSLLPDVNIEDAVVPVSLRVVPLLLVSLGVEVALFGFPSGGAILTLMLGCAKSLSWYSIIQAARYSSWCTAAATGTFGIMSTLSPFMQSSGTKALSHVIASLFSLGQTIHMLPKQASNKSALWVFSLVSLVPYLANIVAIRPADSPQLYFAKSHKSPIIDDFDMIYTAISPFWKLSGKQVIETMDRAQSTADSELWLCNFHGSITKTQCHHPSRSFDRHIQLLFDTLLKDIPGTIPDVKFLVNHLDEPRVVLPHNSQDTDSTKFNLTNLSRQPAWEPVTKHCGSKKGHSSNPVEIYSYGLPFVINRTEDMDLCTHPEYATMNGLFMSPTSLRLFEGLVPILSTGSPLAMGDILYPSPAYIESEFQYDSTKDVAWLKKRNNLYWAGSTTGAFAQTSSWKHYHRQRFVALAQNLETRKHGYIHKTEGVLSSVRSYFLNARLYDVAFTKIFQCETKYCREQRAYFPSKPWADKDKAFKSRLVFDIDGNAINFIAGMA
ncbi:hypothetical protein MGYG_01633 [Nannizzia gypsea CBS 118893]|uniref:Uncharacterized protein n=1 Tax=Arthroderma gypseum (strain ATCC MYA-4604 / CBS 118893) TaxID=535722 RepID=E5R245_ARTGP|nr:hypothetical protein MGYG_01633 [Nannizzia gypsea CBS 118893]EFQ98609.1 hypothetical protein MGYG_01633 [Nannizzia gypsea CBS 118893]